MTWTRRKVLTALGAMAAGGHMGLAAQQTAKPQQVIPPDEMTANTAPHPEVFYLPPDFGPPPTTLPPETLAVGGSASLKAAAARDGRLFGSAVVVHGLAQDPVLAQLVAAQSAILVPEGELKWRALRPAAGSFDFAASDELFRFAREHRLLVRGHTLAWHNSVPDWLERDASTLDVRKLFVEHIQTVVGRYRGRVQSWDVVNEAILPKDGLPGGLRDSFWYRHVGPDYLELAFRTAHAADPHAKLCYNDYGVETESAEDAERRGLILALVRQLQGRGVPIHAVGIQAHIKPNVPGVAPNVFGQGLRDYLAALQAMKLEVYLTEMDVNEDDIVSDEIAVRDAKVAETYRDFLAVALPSPAVRMLLTWGLSDRRTWLNDGPTHHHKQPNRPQRSLPFDPQYRPTPAYFAIRGSFGT